MLATDDPFELAERYQNQRGQWVVGGLETQVFWPNRPQIVRFEGLDFLLQPAVIDGQHRSLPAIAIRANGYGLSVNEGRAAVMRLATAIAWREGKKVDIVMWGGGSSPFRVGRMLNNAITEYFSDENLHVPQSDEARKALAYYREGLSLGNPFYSFLGFYKAFARSLPNGRERGPWIEQTLPQMTDRDAISRSEELEAHGENISQYLATQGRHAIAHAEREDIVDPDDPDDHQRIHFDKPLMRHLAELAMDERLGVRPPSSYERDHLYELEGFRTLFDNEQLEALRRGELAEGREYILPDDFYVMARKGKSCVHLGGMRMTDGGMNEGRLGVKLESPNGKVAIEFWMDFRNERLIIDPIRGCVLLNTRRESRSDIQAEIALEQFKFFMYCNGSVEIWSSDREHRMGKSEAYMLPVNWSPDFTGHQQNLTGLQELLKDVPESGDEATG
ncbi:methylamine utilization protein MauJ [Pseudomonas sp. H3_G03]